MALATGEGDPRRSRACGASASGLRRTREREVATRGLWEVRGEVGYRLGTKRNGERQNGIDHKVAAPPSMVMPAVTTPLAMPTSASKRFC